MTSKAEIRQWFDKAVESRASHMLVVVDTFDYENYPVHVLPDQDVQEVVRGYSDGKHPMQRIVEVYKMSIDREQQLSTDRCCNL